MRRLEGHKVNPANDRINIIVADEPGPGGANHSYLIVMPDGAKQIPLHFQAGPIAENGVNGITQEVLIEICIDRLRGFQNGPFACDANQAALEHLEAAQQALLSRTRDRMERGVEGKSEE